MSYRVHLPAVVKLVVDRVCLTPLPAHPASIQVEEMRRTQLAPCPPLGGTDLVVNGGFQNSFTGWTLGGVANSGNTIPINSPAAGPAVLTAWDNADGS